MLKPSLPFPVPPETEEKHLLRKVAARFVCLFPILHAKPYCIAPAQHRFGNCLLHNIALIVVLLYKYGVCVCLSLA